MSIGIRCPVCDNEKTEVIDSRPAKTNWGVYRRRECPRCDYRFTTEERIVLTSRVHKVEGDR